MKRKDGKLYRLLQVFLALIIIAGLLPVTPSAKAAGVNYYVSPTGCDTCSGYGTSSTTPFKTIQKAADLTNPGDTVYVMNGTYSETVEGQANFVVKRSGSASGGYITYKAYPGHRPKLKVAGVWNHILVTASYIKLEGFEIEGPSESITYDQAYARYTYYRNAKTSNNWSGFDWNYLGQTQTGGIFVRPDNGVTNPPNPHHIEIRSNLIYNCAGGGIGTEKADYVTIEDNIVHHTAKWSVYANSGISVFHPQSYDTNTGYKIFIRRNISHHNEELIPWGETGDYSDGNGIIIDDTKNEQISGTPYNGKILVENNIAYRNGGSGIHAIQSRNIDFVNNSTYKNSQSPHLNYGEMFTLLSDSINFRNNILYANGENVNTQYNDSGISYDHNIFYNGTILVPGSNNITADPKYVNPEQGDFRLLSGSPAKDSGTNSLASTQDIYLTSRPQGSGIDRGAVEVTGVIPNDLIPGKVEAESYSSMSGVIKETVSDTGGGQNAGSIDSNDWMDYTVHVQQPGTYKVEYRIANNNAFSAQLQLKSGGTTLGTLSVPVTNNWQNWQTIQHNVTLSAGTQIIRLHAGTGGFNLNWLTFTKVSGAEIAKTGWSASASAAASYGPASNAIDNDAASKYVNGKSMADGDWFRVDMGSSKTVGRIRFSVDNGNYPRGLEIYVSDSTGSLGEPVHAIRTNGNAVVDASFYAKSGRYVTVKLTASNASWWEIQDLKAYQP
ncbi:carbohydrate-binding protein [Paenibacillus gansuensis]|uniref:Carbohydrate-binding protein n=1 Tax=Paenibacillus gansuensis TaxID=306542 RepID=A0ABW5PA08_9BACL